MRQLDDFSDDRLKVHCAYCHGDTTTRDHVPSKVLLREPFPENLPVVLACQSCNESFSLDEEYLACFLAAVLAGTTDPSALSDPKAARILQAKPALQARINRSRTTNGGRTVWTPEYDRVEHVLVKLAQGHVRYEMGEARDWAPDVVWLGPPSSMSTFEREAFEKPEPGGVWPEVGTRAMQRLIVLDEVYDEGWIEVQAGVYRYHVDWSDGVAVRVVISEYLAALVRWDA